MASYHPPLDIRVQPDSNHYDYTQSSGRRDDTKPTDQRGKKRKLHSREGWGETGIIKQTEKVTGRDGRLGRDPSSTSAGHKSSKLGTRQEEMKKGKT